MQPTVQMNLDGTSFEMEAGTYFETAAQSVKDRISPARVLTEIYIDEKAIDLGEEQRIGQISIDRLGEITFVSKAVSDLLRESSAVAVKVCDAMKYECQDIDDFFEANDLVQAHERIGELSALVDWLLQLMGSLESYGEKTFGNHEVSVGPIKDVMQRMESSLQRLHQHLSQQDFESFRKELSGDFQNKIGEWKEVFSAVSTHWTPRTLEPGPSTVVEH